MHVCLEDYTDDGFYTGAWSDIEQTYGGRSGIDWQDKIFGGSALTQSHNLSLSTGTEKTQVLVSYNNMSQDGIVKITDITVIRFVLK